jgi:hypothetical protein
MNEEQRKISEIARKLWTTLIETGENNLRTTFNVSSKLVMPKQELIDWLCKNVFAGVSLWDEKFHFENIEFYNSLIPHLWGHRRKYLSDVTDCDNFAFYFSATMASIFGLNSAGIASGVVYDLNGKQIDRHAFNLILAVDNGVLKPYLFEPMKSMITEWKGQKTKLDSWLYEIQWQEFF